MSIYSPEVLQEARRCGISELQAYHNQQAREAVKARADQLMAVLFTSPKPSPFTQAAN